MAKFFVTYGYNTNLSNNYSVVEADDYCEARKKIFDIRGRKFSFIYTEDEFIGQPEKYGLTEIELKEPE